MKTLKVLLQEVVSGIKAWVNSNFAQESNTVHKTGNETVNGSKTFTSASSFKDLSRPIRLLFSGDVYNSQPSSSFSTEIDFTDKNDKVMSYICFQHRSDTNETHRLCLRQNRITDSAYYGVNLNNLGDFYPENPNAINLGTSSYQWKSVYAQAYYYNGTAWGLDKANVWSSDQIIQNASIGLKNTSIAKGSNVQAGGSAIVLIDKDDKRLANISTRITSASRTVIELHVENTYKNGLLSTDSDAELIESSWYFGHLWNGTPYYTLTGLCETDICPRDNNKNLGSSNYKWKSFNGINPGALSLPTTVYSDIDTTNRTLAGSTINYTPVLDGWVEINLNVNANSFTRISVENIYYRHSSEAQAGNQAMLTFPVRAGQTYEIKLWGSSILQARFIKCEGNV